MASRKNTLPRIQRRRERAADRLRAALAPESGHRFGTWKRHGEKYDGGRYTVTYDADKEADAREVAEFCLRNLEAKNVRPA